MERREFQRVMVSVDGIFILQKDDIVSREFVGVVQDISEGGFGVVVDRELASNILERIIAGDTLHFSIPDEYKLFEENVESMITGIAEIMRCELSEDNKVILGCRFCKRTPDIEKYVQEKKMVRFLSRINGNNENTEKDTSH